jgi:DNA polymerase-3 subunit beta
MPILSILKSLMDLLTKFSGSSVVFKINGMNVNDYPTIDFSRPMNSIKMDATVLADIIDQTTFATSPKETRPVLTGVNFKLADNQAELYSNGFLSSCKEDN